MRVVKSLVVAVVALMSSLIASPVASAGLANSDLSAQGCSHPNDISNGKITLSTVVDSSGGCVVRRLIAWQGFHQHDADYYGFFRMFGPNGQIDVSATKLWNPSESFRAEVNQAAGFGKLWCSEFWRKNSNGTFTRTANPACSTV